ncbi:MULTISPECIES: NUDIX domain-containing protein [Halobacteriovorax]|uniref:8-oxo-dGTP diphosphatase n=1 Tax=Halobacteriovorax vibrionivorans TaxID=2152716 RepID=A0ABY0IIR8_9BACT|nr:MULTISPECIES: NUDIX domain-containing protein [Halobacteriovorax]RZF22859.1 NUDIX domain-containing protein [Halobacteriovorax vibrionivorans]TGD47348.1 NUDIX domain-containing protein [Halobacteriovorax sp. Y22]
MEISIVIPYRIEEDGIVLFGQKRQEDGPLDGKFEFPGGKIEDGESCEEAARREFLEEVGCELNKISLFTHLSFKYPDRSVFLYVYVTDYIESMNLIAQKISFENAQNEVEELNIPDANKTIIMRLVEHFLRESKYNE